MKDELADLLCSDGLDLDNLDALVDELPEAAPPATNPRAAKPQKQTAGAATGVGHGQVLRLAPTRRRCYDLRNVPNAVRLISPLPARGETLHCIMGGDFAAWDLVPAILELAKRPARELVIATLGFNSQNNWHLCRLMEEGKIRSAHGEPVNMNVGTLLILLILVACLLLVGCAGLKAYKRAAARQRAAAERAAAQRSARRLPNTGAQV